MVLMRLLFEESSSPSPHRGMAQASREFPAAPQAEQNRFAHPALSRGKTDEIECKFAVASPRDGVAEFFLVGGKNFDAFPTARDGHIPLLRVRRGANGGIGKKDVIHGLALRAIRRDGVAAKKLPICGRQRAAVGQFDRALVRDGGDGDNLPVGQLLPASGDGVRFELKFVASAQVEGDRSADGESVEQRPWDATDSAIYFDGDTCWRDADDLSPRSALTSANLAIEDNNCIRLVKLCLRLLRSCEVDLFERFDVGFRAG